MTRLRSHRTLLLATCLVAGLAACGDDAPATTAAEPTATEPAEPTATEPDRPNRSELSACVADGKTLQLAAEVYFTVHGAYPDSLQAMVDEGLVRSGSEFGYDYVLDAAGLPEIVPTNPSCEGVLPGTSAWAVGEQAMDGDTDSSTGDPCAADKRTLEVAFEAYIALTGTTPADEAALVEEQLLRAEAEGYDIVDGQIVVTPGGPCE